MADLRVDYSLLRGLHISLRDIAREFEELHERREADERIWGGSSIRSAMGDFAGNWNIHREEITETITGLAKNCEFVAATFQANDEALGNAAAGRELA